ncbi:hypothetical protein PO909_020192 [Leuciscus waleckii]
MCCFKTQEVTSQNQRPLPVVKIKQCGRYSCSTKKRDFFLFIPLVFRCRPWNPLCSAVIEVRRRYVSMATRHQPPVREICFMFSNPNDNATCQVVSAATTPPGRQRCVFALAHTRRKAVISSGVCREGSKRRTGSQRERGKERERGEPEDAASPVKQGNPVAARLKEGCFSVNRFN